MSLNVARNIGSYALERSATASDSVASLPEILYVMGTGRSGTTILEVLLANESGFAGTGELKHIFRDGYLRDLPCACGASARQCVLWSGVLNEMGWDREDCIRMRNAVDRLENHARFSLVYAGLVDAKTLRVYREATAALFRCVARMTSSRVVVDSSKYPARALLLARMFPGNVMVLCITRSARGLLAAFQKKNDDEQRPKSRLAASVYYLYVLLCMRLVKAKLKERCFAIRFEDLNRNPSAVLQRIERWSGYEFAQAHARLAAGESFDVGHIVTGNRLRKQGRVKFEPRSAETLARGVASPLFVRLLESYRRVLGF